MALDFEPRLQAVQVNAADSTSALAALQQWVFWAGVRLPAESALSLGVLLFWDILHMCLLNLYELLEEFIIRWVEDGVGSMTALIFDGGRGYFVDFHVLGL